MSTWTYNADEKSYSAKFPVAGDPVEITVSEDDFSREEDCEFLPLIEGHFYHYEISRAGRLDSRSSFLRGAPGNKGKLAPGTSVGYGRLWLEGLNDPDTALNVEVSSTIIGWKDDFEKLLAELTGYVADLQMQVQSDVQYNAGVDEESASQNAIQRFFFLLGIVNDGALDRALRHIVENPHVRLKTVESQRDIRHAMRFGASTLHQIASAHRRVESPEGIRNRLPTLPESLHGTIREETVDVFENRFVKHVLVLFRNGLQEFKDRLPKVKPEGKHYSIELDIDAGLNRLDSWLGSDFFRGISPLTAMSSSSVVLQRKEGYRDVLRKWLQSKVAATMMRTIGEDTSYRDNQKDVATLYEYWCFFRLLDIIKGLFNINEDQVAEIFVGSNDGLSLKINEGKSVSLNGYYVPAKGKEGGRYRALTVKYQYNRRFSRNDGSCDSWTMLMIPDYTLSFWPKGMKEEEAQKLDLVTYVHFDAKYKAQEIASLIDENDDSSAYSTEDAKYERDVKRIDILKMHAYRDAIPHTAGAYVLYPGKTRHKYEMYRDEMLPGLGAFPLYPGNDDGEPIRDFLASAADYLCDRISRWEDYTYQKNRIYSSNIWKERQSVLCEALKSLVQSDLVDSHRVNFFDLRQLVSAQPEQIWFEQADGEKQLDWINRGKFAKSVDKNLRCEPDKLRSIVVAYPNSAQPLKVASFKVMKYLGESPREELDSIPFPGNRFYVWEVEPFHSPISQ